VSRFLPEFLNRTVGSGLFSARSPVAVGVNAHGAAWLERGNLGLPQWRYLPWPGATPLKALALLNQQLLPTVSSTATLILAPSLIRHWMQSPPAQIASLNELRSVALARCTQLFGSQPSAINGESGWALSANWHASQAFMCTAVPSVWMQALEHNPSMRHANDDILARTLRQHRRALPRDGWLAIAIAQSLYLLQLQHDRVINLRMMRIPMHANAAQMQQTAVDEWTREMLRTHSQAITLHWLCAMPGSQTRTLLPPLKVISYLASAQIPAPPSALSSEFIQGVEPQHVHEALLTAWCAQNNLVGAGQ
jgi:hypothetical protein